MVARQAASKNPRIPEVLQEMIEEERGNLAKADSILVCLILAMEYGAEAPHREGGSVAPYYPDVARIARDLVRGAIHRLDSLHLQQQLERDKIAEPGLTVVPCGPAHLTVVEIRRHEPGSGSGNGRRLGRLPGLRLHRRVYRGETSSAGARRASASANMSGGVAR
jgi:hypothetical protein